MLQTAHLPILPLPAILYVTAKEQLDVTSRQLNSLALVCNWSIKHSFMGEHEAADMNLVLSEGGAKIATANCKGNTLY